MKGERTRQLILEATLHCLVDWGYSHTTNEAVARRAGVSRGALTHHFPSREALFKAFAEYLTTLRIAEYTTMVRGVVEGMQQGHDMQQAMRLTLDLMDQDYAKSPGFHALQEFLRGARGDRRFGRLAAELARDIDARELQVRAELLPVWQDLPETSEVLRDLTVYALISLTLSAEACEEPRRRNRLLDLIAAVATRELEQAMALRRAARGLETANVIGTG